MPAEHPIPAIHDQSQADPSQPQVKLCLACCCPLAPDTASAAPFLLHDGTDTPVETTLVCASCRSRLPSQPPLRDGLFAEVERELLRRAASLQPASNEAVSLASHESAQSHSPSFLVVEPCPPPELVMETPTALTPRAFASPTPDAQPSHSASVHPARFDKLPTSPASSLVSARPTLAPIDTSHASSSQAPAAQRADQSSVSHASGSRQRNHVTSSSAPDPLLDITRLRVRSQGHHCLYPGATFQGTQKSGRNSYDVNVTIVDVDFASSHLCGYLRIRGLTDDWPELTTYFDAEIIGSRYGFLTRNWGATESEDMVHWGRFPAFRHVKNELNKPHLTMKDALNRGAVFMRWKEKFLVPDHRVQDINGASFAGFYYVCVDFNPQQTGSVHLPSPADDAVDFVSSPTTTQSPPPTKPDAAPRSRRISPHPLELDIPPTHTPIHLPPPPPAPSNMPGLELFGNSNPANGSTIVEAPQPAAAPAPAPAAAVSAEQNNGAVTSTEVVPQVPRSLPAPAAYYNPRLDPKNFLEGPLSWNPATRLRQMLARPGIVVAPGICDGISARCALEAGFDCLYQSGAATTASRLGQPDLAIATLNDFVQSAQMVCSLDPTVPVIADADTGFGGPAMVARTVTQYARAGVAALHIEDQVQTKRCGHLLGKQVVSREEFLTRIRAAVIARDSIPGGSDFVIIGRTDSAQVLGMEEAIIRLQLAAAAGADVCFIEGVRSADLLTSTIEALAPKPVLVNVISGGLTPSFTTHEAEQLGAKIIIFSLVSCVAAVHGIRAAMQSLKKTGTDFTSARGMDPKAFFEVMGLNEVVKLDAQAGGKAFEVV